MRAITPKISILLFSCFGMALCSLEAQQFRTISAQNAIEQVQQRFGPDAIEWISEIKATGGQPQPLQWDIVAFDRKSPGLLHHYRASAGVVQDGGPDSRRYPNQAPNGYFNITAIGVDSVAAFTIAEAEARKARLGFDSCDYFLQLREFSNETVWRLELVDASHRLVGSVHISGTNGQVLRTIWMQRDTISGFPKILDSMSPVPPSFTGDQRMTPGAPGGIDQSDSDVVEFVPSPYSPVPSTGMNPQNPSNFQSGTGSNSGIFRQFPPSGGGESRNPIAISSNNPLDPQPATAPAPPPGITIPREPDTIPMPLEPAPATPPAGPAPPISISGGEGSSARIPPPPVPQ
ncbi:MAG: hypothetical protein P1V20_28550 [Verrucomicrobiales bacterium]|nr:hypothetical protein [Verrucomicrobiales bacterium]